MGENPSCRLSPESTGSLFNMAGLLTCFGVVRLPNHRDQWQKDARPFMKLTATGIVPDFHRVPF